LLETDNDDDSTLGAAPADPANAPGQRHARHSSSV
jgi:hypothetical protein